MLKKARLWTENVSSHFFRVASPFYHQTPFNNHHTTSCKSSSRKLFRIPVLRMSSHHRLSQCDVLHDFRNGFRCQLGRAFVSLAWHQPNRYVTRGREGGGSYFCRRYLDPSSLYNPVALHGPQLPPKPLNSRLQSSPPSVFAGAGCNHECNVRFCANAWFPFLTFFNVKSVTM